MSAPDDAAEREPAEEPRQPAAAPEEPEAKKKRGKRSKKGARPEPEALPGEGTPEGAMLREASAAFDAGDYALVRTLTAKLASASDRKVADAAAGLARRVAVDPVQIGFLVVCLVAICIIFYVYVIR